MTWWHWAVGVCELVLAWWGTARTGAWLKSRQRRNAPQEPATPATRIAARAGLGRLIPPAQPQIHMPAADWLDWGDDEKVHHPPAADWLDWGDDEKVHHPPAAEWLDWGSSRGVH